MIMNLEISLLQSLKQRQNQAEVAPLFLEIVRSSAPLKLNWHPLGFLHVRLLLDKDGSQLRLHAWPSISRQIQNPAWLVHSHTWPVVSHILCGSVTNTFWSVQIVSSSKATGKLYRVEYDTEKSILKAEDTFVSHMPGELSTYTIGSKYTVPLDVYHTSIVEEGVFAATLVYTPPPQRPHPFVVGASNGAQEYQFRRALCPDSISEGVITAIVDNISSK